MRKMEEKYKTDLSECELEMLSKIYRQCGCAQNLLVNGLIARVYSEMFEIK